MPVSQRSGALHAVIAHEHRQSDIPAEDGSHRARHLRFEEDVVAKPVLKDDGTRSFGRMLVEIGECAAIYLVRHETFQHEGNPLCRTSELGYRSAWVRNQRFYSVHQVESWIASL